MAEPELASDLGDQDGRINLSSHGEAAAAGAVAARTPGQSMLAARSQRNLAVVASVMTADAAGAADAGETISTVINRSPEETDASELEIDELRRLRDEGGERWGRLHFKQCRKEVFDALFPFVPGAGRLKPPMSVRESVDEIAAWREKSAEEQRTFISEEKAAEEKAKEDRKKQREANRRDRERAERSRRRQAVTEQQRRATVTPPPPPIDPLQLDPMVSLGDSQELRDKEVQEMEDRQKPSTGKVPHMSCKPPTELWHQYDQHVRDKIEATLRAGAELIETCTPKERLAVGDYPRTWVNVQIVCEVEPTEKLGGRPDSNREWKSARPEFISLTDNPYTPFHMLRLFKDGYPNNAIRHQSYEHVRLHSISDVKNYINDWRTKRSRHKIGGAPTLASAVNNFVARRRNSF